MTTVRTAGLVVAAVFSAALLAGPMPTALADQATEPSVMSADGRPRLLASTTMGWVEGERRWVSLPWMANEGIQDLTVVATSSAPGVEILYADDTMTYAALANGPELSANEIDVTRIGIATSTATPRQWEIRLVATWEYRGREFEGISTIDMTTIAATIDESLQPLTGAATVASTGDGASNWVSLDYFGLAKETSGVEISVEGQLPAKYTSTLFAPLHHDDVLVEGEVDSARIWFDPERITPGTYHLTVKVSYRTDASTVVNHASHPLVVTVE